MTVYMPIMKGKPGEFAAWHNATSRVRANMRPLFEVAPGKDVNVDLQHFTDRLIKATTSPTVITVDFSHINRFARVAGTRYRAIRWTANQLLANQLSMRPVFRLSDPAVVVNDVRDVAGTHNNGACLRIDGTSGSAGRSFPPSVVNDILARLHLPLSDVHLVIDMVDITDQAALARSDVSARATLTWALALGKWASITVASGAFPRSISTLATATANTLPRYDAALWRSLAANHAEVDFGDYGINHPSMLPSGWLQGPLPNLRYTDARNWQVWRERKALPGNQSYFTLCARATRHRSSRGAGFSWGDAEVDRCSNGIGGAGAATQWRAQSTSHHLATVVERLATLGEP